MTDVTNVAPRAVGAAAGRTRRYICKYTPKCVRYMVANAISAYIHE